MDQGISNTQLGFGYWYVTHKLVIKKIVAVVLAIVDFGLIGFVGYSLSDAYGIRFNQHREILTSLYSGGQLNNLSVIKHSQFPQQLQVQTIRLLPGGENTDILATIVNPNIKWGARFTYSFVLASGATRERDGFIFPGETKQLVDLNVPGGATASDVIISNIEWVRDNNFAETYSIRYNFLITDVRYQAARETELSENVPVSRATFTVKNNSPYNYRTVRFLVNLLAGTQIVAVNTTSTESLRSGETKTLEATWFTNLPSVQNVQIVPQIDILNPDVYLEFEGENGIF